MFPAEALRALVVDAEGTELTLAEIERLAARITAHYRKEGYILSEAYVPAQDMPDGVVEIAVLEGRIGKVEVRGARRYSPDYLRSYLTPVVEAPAFHAGRAERSLRLLNDLPGLAVTSTLTRGTEVGTTDIVLDVEKERLITAALEANNYGSRVTGRERFGVSLSLNNPFRFGDVFGLRGVVSREAEDLWFAQASYAAPLNTQGTRVGAAYAHIESEAGQEFRDLGILGAGDVGSLHVVHPIIARRALSLHGRVGFDYKNFQTDVLGERVSRDRLRVFTSGASLEAIDQWKGVSHVGLTVHQGVGGFLGGLGDRDDPNASREGAGGTFTELTAEGSRLQHDFMG